MSELFLTVYGDHPHPLGDPAFLLNQFPTPVRVSWMQFEQAWPKLLDYALNGNGPHISLIGSVWTSTLRSMNVLRPFSTQEINSLGGASAFFPSGWNVFQPGENEIWGIPFELFTYLVLYRKDRLAQAGVNEASAFSSPQAMVETVQRLKSAGVPSPLVLPSGKPFPARPHLLASWIWGAGGNFIDPSGRSVCFTEPKAIRAMADFFSLYRLQTPADCGLDVRECLDRFASGSASIVIAGITGQQVVEQVHHAEVLANIGVAPLPGVPWVGGSEMVIWKEARMNPETERAALELTRFLTTPAAQEKIAAAQHTIPARAESLAQHAYSIPAYRTAVEKTVRTGRSYPRVNQWVSTLRLLRSAFDMITAEVIKKPDDDVAEILQRQLNPLVNRVNLMLF